MLNGILNQRVLVGHDIKAFTEMLKADQTGVVYSIRDLKLVPEIAGIKSNKIAKDFFDAEIDEHFRSTIVEARLWLALYRSFETEIEDRELKL